MTHQDTLVGVALLAFCAVIYWLTTGFPEVPVILSQNVPPTFFPRLVIGLITLLSIVLIFNGLGKSAQVNVRIKPVVLITASIIVLAGVLVGFLGTLLTLALIAIAIPVAWGERRLRPLGILAVGLPAAIYLIFGLALGIRFPPGQLLDWLL